MKADIIIPDELDATLIADWRRFQETSPGLESPFFAPEFTLAVATARSDARVAVIWDAGEVVAFLPFHIGSGGVAKPIGGQICDYQGIIHDAAFSATAVDLLRACGLAAYDFNHAPVSQAALLAGAYQFSVSPQMDLGDGYEVYAAGQSRSSRRAMREVRRQARKIEEDLGPIRFEFQDDSPEAYDRHVEMRNSLYARANVKSLLGCGSWVDRTIEASRTTAAPDFAAVFSTLYAGEHLIAAHLGLRSRRIWHWWFNSYNTNFHKYGPGKLLIYHAAMNADAHGLGKIDFGRGEAPYKQIFANTREELCEGSVEASLSLPGLARQLQRVNVGALNRLPLGTIGDLCRRGGNRVLTGGVRI